MRVLVAEDNKVNQQVILRMLRLEKVQDVTVAKDGQEALDTVQKSMALDGLHFALVFMDILMPNMDGIESTKRIRDLGFSAPIVALTAFADESNKEACMKAGMNAFLGKPIKRHSLKQVLEEFGKPLLPMPGEGNAKGSVEVPTDFITQRRIRLHDFLPLYERNAEKIGSKKTRVSEYDHTLSTVWEMSLARLSGPAAHLQKLLAFFEPDAIHEIILLEGSSLLDDQELKFLEDEMDLGDAEEVLLRAALIGKSLEDGILSVRRLVQAAVMRSLSKDERTRYFDAAVCMLKWGFPDTWSKDVGHQIQAWTKCEKCLPHANRLVTVASKYDISFNKPDQFGDLLLRCSWYLYEREQYDLARTFAATALDTFLDKESLAFASAIDLLGLIDLDMNQPISALDPFNRALRIRQARLGPDDPFIAFSLNNLAIAYTEIPDLAKAAELHEKAIAIRLQNNSGRIGNSYSNLAVLLLRMGKPDEAEETLMKCPSLKDCTDETFLNTGNPRFVGDMVLLSRIRRAQGRIQDALRLASKALSWRQKVHGDRFKTCDSLYDVACLLHQQQRSASAIDLLRQLVVKLGDEMA